MDCDSGDHFKRRLVLCVVIWQHWSKSVTAGLGCRSL